MMKRVPEGVVRDMTRRRIEAYAARQDAHVITAALVEEKYADWGKGAAGHGMTLDWDDGALARVNRIPGFVRPMVILEVERCARTMGLDRVTGAAIDRASGVWTESGAFHSEAEPGLYERTNEAGDDESG